VVLTSDNPARAKTRSPSSPQMRARAGALVRQPQVQPDRAQAIALVLAAGRAAAQDVVLIAGKGHEDYQEVRRPAPAPSRIMAEARAALLARTRHSGGAGGMNA
jgi:UDP-N-acetylmuramyl tripeptide synthase